MRRSLPPVLLVLICIAILAGPVLADSPAPQASGTASNTTRISDLIASEPPGHVVVYFFYNQFCGECQKSLTFFEGFRERHPEVVVRSFDIANNPDNQQLFQQFDDRYGVPLSPVPAVFTGEWEIMGNENIQSHLDEIVSAEEANLTAGSPPFTLPAIPSITTTGTQELTVPIVIGSAIVDGLNPCALAVLLFLLVTIVSVGSRKRMLQVGLTYIGAVFLFYLISGLGVFAFVQVTGIPKIFSTVAAAVAIIVGLVMIKEAFYPGRGLLLAIPESKKDTITRYIHESTLPAAFILGILVGIFELPCTGGIYLAILSMITSRMTVTAGLPLLILYNIAFVIPLLITLAIVYFGIPPERLENWRNERRLLIRLIMGLVMIGIGIIVLWTVFNH
ncbi:MAG TPA: cytochrome c biogenesis CcdA family protein [Methanoregulaceae archaeon]|nr:cytochrome c biogenesis CcdA family protein [Methanoregulaceae archaeon]